MLHAIVLIDTLTCAALEPRRCSCVSARPHGTSGRRPRLGTRPDGLSRAIDSCHVALRAAAVERRLYSDADRCWFRLQPLGRSRSYALARRPDLRGLGKLRAVARFLQRCGLVGFSAAL